MSNIFVHAYNSVLSGSRRVVDQVFCTSNALHTIQTNLQYGENVPLNVMEVTDAITILGFAQTTIATVTTVGVQTAALSAGIYMVTSTNTIYVKVHATTASDVTTATGYPVFAGEKEMLVVADTAVIGAVIAAGTATATIHRVR